MILILELFAMYAFWALFVVAYIHKQFKKAKRAILKDVNRKLYQDRQIRSGSVGTVTRIDSGRTGSSSGS